MARPFEAPLQPETPPMASLPSTARSHPLAELPAGVRPEEAVLLEPVQLAEIQKIAAVTLQRFAKFAQGADVRTVHDALERALLFVLTRAGAEGLAPWTDDISRIALTWGDLLAKTSGWSWASWNQRGSRCVGLVSASRTHAVVPVDLVLDLLESKRVSQLKRHFQDICSASLPPGNPGFLSVLSG